MNEAPNQEWYVRRSLERGVGMHCPFATVHTYFRHYDSISLMGQAGATSIPEKEDEALLKKWKASGLYPVTHEQQTSTWGDVGGVPHAYSNFCPEVTLEFFGTAASYLSRYADEIDRYSAHKLLATANTAQFDPHWEWQSVKPMHFTDCAVYAVLLHMSTSTRPASGDSLKSKWGSVADVVGHIATAIEAVWKAIKAFGI